MNFSAFKETLQTTTAPAEVSVYLKALWYDANGDWQEAHNLIENLPDKTAARIHAYLHRKEGDQGNALYWYRRAGMQGVNTSLETEWEDIVRDVICSSDTFTQSQTNDLSVKRITYNVKLNFSQ